MHTITFFAPKGGAGRTTAVMATASAFIESGYQVGVLDMTEEAQRWQTIGQSCIRQWQTSMLTSGIGPDQLMTSSAWDFDSLYSAKADLRAAGCTHILIDTPKAPNKLIEYVLLECGLIVMPFSGYFEATWISSWVTSNLCPVRKMFGLATGLTGTDEHQAIHRQALYGSPMLKNSLPRSHVFANQLIDGSFYKLEAGSDASRYTDADLLHARSSAAKLIEELNRLAKTRSFSRYRRGEQLATGHPLAHLKALYAKSPEAFC